MINVFLPLLDWSAFRRNDEDPQGMAFVHIELLPIGKSPYTKAFGYAWLSLL